ncbi:hypothetical protein BH10ACI1_BH10ACI1_23250 [soil metagenome]
MKRRALVFFDLTNIGNLSGIAILLCFLTSTLLAQGGSGRITPTTRGTTKTTTTTTKKPNTTATTTRRTTTRTTTRRTTTRTFDYYYKLGSDAYDEKDYEKAIANYTQAIRLNSQSADTYYNRALAYYDSEDYEKAIADYTKSIQLKPGADAYNNRGLAYELNGNYKLAADDYRTALRIQPGYALAKTNLARVESTSTTTNTGGGGGAGDGNNRTTTTTTTTNNAEYYADLADGYYEKDDFDNALVNYNKAIQLDPRSAGSYVRRGFIYHYTGEVAKAYEDYDTAVRLNPALKNEAYMKCMIYDVSNDDANMGVRVCTDTINEFPSFSLAYYKRGVAYRELGNSDRALADFTKSIDIRPNFFNSYVYRGLIYSATNKYSAAVTEYTNAIRIVGANNPKSYLSYNNRGAAYEGLGNYTQAAADYRKSYELNPNFTTAKDNLDKVIQKQRGNY